MTASQHRLRLKTAKIARRLEEVFGIPKVEQEDPMDCLIGCILSQNTSDVNSDRAFDKLKERFPTWEDALAARPRQIAAAIRCGGLADQKSVWIHDILTWLMRTRGKLDLKFLRKMPVPEAVRLLTGLKGVGMKTASIVMVFSCSRDVFPVDTHVHRVCRRLGLIPADCTADEAHELMAALVPKGKALSFHLHLIWYGRRYCKARNPSCPKCRLGRFCVRPWVR
jgi:endonuclease-3